MKSTDRDVQPAKHFGALVDPQLVKGLEWVVLEDQVAFAHKKGGVVEGVYGERFAS